MTQIKVQKTFDSLDFKQNSQQQIFEATKNLTASEEIHYLHHQAISGALGRWWQSIKKPQPQKNT